MAKAEPWHSATSRVHHICSGCNLATHTLPADVLRGTGGKPVCAECEARTLSGEC